jgi:hypothetical protein
MPEYEIKLTVREKKSMIGTIFETSILLDLMVICDKQRLQKNNEYGAGWEVRI